MYKLLLCLGLILSANVNAASQINYLNVDGDVVHFSLAEAKSHTIPSCVAAETTDRYAVLLTNEAGRAMYSLLITAMASKQAITVESANDCADVVGVERPKGVSIVPVIEEAASDKIQWAGYTNAVKGNFPNNKSPFAAGSQLCAAKYPGSRLMLWDDYVHIQDVYPSTQAIWFIDGLQSNSNAISRSNYDSYTKSSLVYKNGQVVDFTISQAGNEFSNRTLPNYISCDSWRSEFSRHSGIVMGTTGLFYAQTCDVGARLACVK